MSAFSSCKLLPMIACRLGQARRKRGGGWGGFSPPNNLLKFIDFVSEKDCKSHDRRNEDSNSYILEEATRIYQKCSIFDVIQVKNFKIFLERHSLVVILCFRQWHIFQKYVVFQRFKACGHGKFSRGQFPSTPVFLTLLAPRFSPPNMNFVPTGLRPVAFWRSLCTIVSLC